MKYWIILFVIFCSFTLNANILVCGPYAEELMWIENEWYLELTNTLVEPYTLGFCYIYNDTNYSNFLDVYFPPGGATVVTKDSLAAPFDFGLQTDELILGWEWEPNSLGPSCCVHYGNGFYSMQPREGESLVRQFFISSWYEVLAIEYCRDNTPTLGEFNDDTGYTGNFSGSILNADGNPLAGAVIEYFPWNMENEIISDLNGNFEKEMYTIRYDIQVKFQDITYIDSTICIAPDSTTICNFVLPVTNTEPSLSILKNAEINNFPNPFNPSTTIQFSIPMPMDDVKIEIYNNKGQQVRTFTHHQITQSTNHQIVWNGTDQNKKQVASGVYFARLIGDGLLLKECKMLLLK